MFRPVSVCARRFVSRSQARSKDGPGEELDRTRSGAVKKSAREDASSGMRMDLIARVRQEIADGTYDTPEKWEAALARLLERLDLS